MLFNNDKISIRQLQVMFILDLFGSVVLSLPRMTTSKLGPDAWVSVIIGTLFALIYAVIISKLTLRFQRDTFVGYSMKILGKYLGILLSIIFLGYLVMLVGLELRLFGEITKEYILPSTPLEVILISILFVITYLVRKGYEVKARFAEFVFIFIFIPFMIFFFLLSPTGDLTNLLPVFHSRPIDILKSSFYTSLNFIVLAQIMLYVPFFHKPKQAPKAIFQGVIITGILQVLVVVITIMRFGVEDTQNMLWPVLSIMNSVQVPGAVIQRQEGIVMVFWTITIFSVIAGFYHGASLIMSKILHAKEHNFLVLPLLPIVYLVAIRPQNIAQVFTWGETLRYYLSIVFLLVIPLLLLIIAHIKGIRGEECEESKE